jgi:threonylcarbamoyladenosine tRNA methylthiotransferase CDKAL1
MEHDDPDVVEDIEDLIKNEEDAPVERLERTDEILPRPRGVKSSLEPTDGLIDPSIDSNIPGIQKIYVKTWGCAHNNSDGEYMAGQLAAYGYQVTDSEKEADSAQLWLLNSCTVKVRLERES